MEIKVKTTERGDYGMFCTFFLEKPAPLRLNTDFKFRGVWCRIVSHQYDENTKLTDIFFALPLRSDQRIPKYRKYTKIDIKNG